MARRALVVGIDEYQRFKKLNYAESDARAIARRLKFHGDQATEPNYDVRLLLSGKQAMTRPRLREELGRLFAESRGLDVAFYFSGHGHIGDAGGYLVTADGAPNDHGVSMQELADRARASEARSVLIALDCCHAGEAGDATGFSGSGQQVVLRDNMAIMAASLPLQSAMESPLEGGLFTAALTDALDGAAADILGEVSVASAYSLIEKRFSLWEQRPVAKAYLSRPILLRRVKPRISRQDLRRIVEFFPTLDHQFAMDPDHDPERDAQGRARTPEVPAKVEIGRLFKIYRDVNLIEPSQPGMDLYYVAQRSQTVELTMFGREFWRLVNRERV